MSEMQHPLLLCGVLQEQGKFSSHLWPCLIPNLHFRYQCLQPHLLLLCSCHSILHEEAENGSLISSFLLHFSPPRNMPSVQKASIATVSWLNFNRGKEGNIAQLNITLFSGLPRKCLTERCLHCSESTPAREGWGHAPSENFCILGLLRSYRCILGSKMLLLSLFHVIIHAQEL